MKTCIIYNSTVVLQRNKNWKKAQNPFLYSPSKADSRDHLSLIFRLLQFSKFFRKR